MPCTLPSGSSSFPSSLRAWLTTAFHNHDTPIDLLGLYWHFVDIVWVFLFPLIYLVDRHS